MKKQLCFHTDIAQMFFDYKDKLKKMYTDLGRSPVSIDNNSTMAFLINGTTPDKLLEENNNLKGIIEKMVEERKEIRKILENINMSNGQKIKIDIDNIKGLSSEFF